MCVQQHPLQTMEQKNHQENTPKRSQQGDKAGFQHWELPGLALGTGLEVHFADLG